MCCAGTEYSEKDIDGSCSECGAETVEGDAFDQCDYSPTDCEKCGSAPCDLSC